MKTCPVCKARCFDDMDVCYGCMHQFDEEALEEPGAGIPAGKKPLRSAYVFGASGSRENGSDEVEDAATVAAPAEPAGEVEAPVAAHAASKEGGVHPKGIAVAGDMKLSLRDIDAEAVSKLMNSALDHGRRLIICIE